MNLKRALNTDKISKIMYKIAHIYASNAKANSGDFMLGISTKKYFQTQYLKDKECSFTDFDCRESSLFTPQNITQLNNFDYILIGGGGLILPDSNPNKVSGWQWSIPKESYNLIKKPLYVISIGYNLFYNQDMTMPNRENSNSDLSRLHIFKENIEALIKTSHHFSLRHKGDVRELLKIVDSKYQDKIQFEPCPSIWYVDNFWEKSKGNLIGIEIKDDRPNRRYYKIGKDNYYKILKDFIVEGLSQGLPLVYMSHDGSKSFYEYLKQHNINLPYLNNATANEENIKGNYSKLKTLLCSAGHSQMISYANGINIISLASHPKLEYFCEDINDTSQLIVINDDPNILNKLKTYAY